MPTICKECKWAERKTISPEDANKLTGKCLTPDAPVDNFIMGEKTCILINNGHCHWFEKSK